MSAPAASPWCVSPAACAEGLSHVSDIDKGDENAMFPLSLLPDRLEEVQAGLYSAQSRRSASHGGRVSALMKAPLRVRANAASGSAVRSTQRSEETHREA